MEEDLKPIIVSGVDVSKCEFLTKTRHCRAHMSIMGIDTNKCKCFPNCYFKQLTQEKRECEKAKQNAQDTYDLWQALIESFNILQGEKIKLEQECESWKKANDDKNELVAKLGCPTTATARKEVFVLQQQIDQLKEELKEQTGGLRPELKRLINKICRKYDIEAKTYHKKIVEIIHSLDDYNQALINIGEILKQGIKIHDDIIVSKQILQKAREVENEG